MALRKFLEGSSSMMAVTTLFICGSSLLHSAKAKADFEPLLDPKAMDLSADPCVDFQQYACGSWVKNTPLPEDEPSWYRSFSTIDRENRKINKAILEGFAAGVGLDQVPNAKKLGDFYSSCMDLEAIQKGTPVFLSQLYAQIDELSLPNFSRKLGEFHRRGFRTFISFGSEQDFQDSSKMIATLDQGGMGLPGKDYYFDEKKGEIRTQYLGHIARVLILTGLAPEDAQKKAEAILKFETALAQVSLRRVERREPKNLYHIHSLSDLQSLTPKIQWSEFFKATGSPDFTSLNIAVPGFYSGLNSILQDTPLDFLKTYLRWRFVSAVASDLGGEFAKERHRFYGQILSGQSEMTPRWKYCQAEADSSLPDALGRAFVAHTNEGKKKEALEILTRLQNVFRENLKAVDWMDEATRQVALKKLDGFVKKIGYPDQWKDLSGLKIGKNHLENALAAAEFVQGWEFAKIGKKADRNEWYMSPSTVNAYYNPPNNEIVFPAGILQTPIFESSREEANLGALGSIMGHEMTHGFDDQGRKFDLEGNLVDWWSPEIGQAFDQKAQCLVDQYNKYEVADGIHVDGKLTLGENIADLGGIKLAYQALAPSLSKETSPSKRLQKEKDFFTAYAQLWCSKSTPEFEKMLVATNPHAPGKFRIIGVLSNIPEFAKAFGCKVGQPLAPQNRCSVW